VDRALGDVSLPRGCVVAAVVRAGTPVVPDRSYVLRPGDELLVVAQTAAEHEIHDAFQ
jgi:Trk K+ transport system NAD-binding subunit